MTRFLTSEIPEQIQSIEQLIVWCGEILQRNYPDKTFVYNLDQDGEPVKIRAVEADDFYYTAPEPAEYRYTARFEIALHPDFIVYGRIWDHAQPLGSSAIPPQMRRVTV